MVIAVLATTTPTPSFLPSSSFPHPHTSAYIIPHPPTSFLHHTHTVIPAPTYVIPAKAGIPRPAPVARLQETPGPNP